MRAPLKSLTLTALVVAACTPRAPAPEPADPTPVRPARATTGETATSPSSEPVFGAPRAFDNVAIYPVLLGVQTDPGPLVLLERALADGQAEVREVGGEDGQAVPVVNLLNRAEEAQLQGAEEAAEEPQVQRQAGINFDRVPSGGPTVNTLVIENRGEVPVYVLAGTVVKGGNQDRQIGQDFVVAPGSAVPVDAFCVEHGRWDTNRAGTETGGKFAVVPVMATSKVRAAAQYAQDQGTVWNEVSVANATFKKTAESDTLLATLDDAEVTKQIDALATRISAALDAVAPSEQLVGFAYAIDGEVRGARWFSHRRIYALAKDKLVRTLAVDALAAQNAAKAAGNAVFSGPAPKAEAVGTFIAEVEAVATEEKRETRAGNDNHYRESAKAWGSRTVLHKGRMQKPAARAAEGAAPAAEAQAVPISFDFVAK